MAGIERDEVAVDVEVGSSCVRRKVGGLGTAGGVGFFVLVDRGAFEGGRVVEEEVGVGEGGEGEEDGGEEGEGAHFVRLLSVFYCEETS